MSIYNVDAMKVVIIVVTAWKYLVSTDTLKDFNYNHSTNCVEGFRRHRETLIVTALFFLSTVLSDSFALIAQTLK